MQLNIDRLRKWKDAPEKFAAVANLIYVKNKDLTIRRHKHGRGFYYTDNRKRKIKARKQIERFKKLRIPPRWQEVKISPIENGHLQAVGRDTKQRKVYKYHPIWSKFKNQTKFFKMLAFGKKLPIIRKRLEKDLSRPGMPKEKVLAIVIKLLEETHIRVGNQYYAKKNKTYGLSTLRSKHISRKEDEMSIDFIGKKGKKHHIVVDDPELMRLINKCEEIPGWELFSYYDKNGNKETIDSGLINNYIQSSCGEFYSAKDFRTWGASCIFYEYLVDLPKTEDQKTIEKNILKAYDETAKNLGNTREVCKKYYVHPIVPQQYKKGALNEMDNVSENKYLSPTECQILKLVESYELSIPKKESSCAKN